MLELQLRDINQQPLNDYLTALTLAVALRDALAELLGVQSAELGCDAREVRNHEGTRCQSIFIFDRYAAGYASGSENLVTQLFHKAAGILECPKHCDASCPNCIVDFDQRFEASKLDRYAALKFLNSTWLKMLKLPDELCFFGTSSRVETATLLDAVLRESGGADASATRLFVDGTGADFAASGIRRLVYKLLSLSRPVSVAITKDSLSKLSEYDRYSLAALADHPGASIHVIVSVPLRNGAITVAEVGRANGCVAWACSDAAITKAAEGWGTSPAPLVIGNSTATKMNEACSPSSLRPAVVLGGDADISIQHQLDGDIQSFGLRFWKFVSQIHPASKKVLENSGATVMSLTYSDRYLFTPVSVALLHSVVAGLKQVISPERFGIPDIFINTTAVRQDGQRWLGGKVFADWPTSQMRDAVAELALQSFGSVKISNPDKLQHSRVLELSFSTGEVLALRLDQGLSYWRVSSWSKGGTKGTWYDFANPNTATQAKAVASMDVWVEGQVAPTQVFAKLRTAKCVVADAR
jgi:DEAD/DEAH box helicase domain-containing protein